MNVRSILTKLATWKADVDANQPIDRLAVLSPDERAFYKKWSDEFGVRHDDPNKSEALYAAWLEYGNRWTPIRRLEPDFANMTLEKMQDAWADIRDAGKIKRRHVKY